MLDANLEREYRRAAAGETRDFENYYEPWKRWFHSRCFPREGGGMTVYFEDITERKKTEEVMQRHVAELNALNQELTAFNRVAVGRELRMIELKEQVNELCLRLGQPPQYPLEAGTTQR